jgi:hypothetical protein
VYLLCEFPFQMRCTPSFFEGKQNLHKRSYATLRELFEENDSNEELDFLLSLCGPNTGLLFIVRCHPPHVKNKK